MKNSVDLRKLSRKAYIVSLVGVLLGSPVFAQASRNAVVYTAMSIDQVSTAMVAKGYKATVSTDTEGNKFLVFNDANKNYAVILADCNKNLCSTLEVYVGIPESWRAFTLEELNDWNSSNFFAYAYRGSDKTTYLASDLNLDGGVSANAVSEWVATFVYQVNQFLTKFKL